MRKRTPSPAMIVAVIALCLGLGGAAIAADLSKSQVKKIAKKQATKVLNKREAGLNVNSAKTATSAASAASATNAANADAVDGVSIVPISHRSGNVTDAVIATAGELTFRVTCSGGPEVITATTTNTGSSEISAISNDAGAADGAATQSRGTVDDSFDETDTFDVGPDGGDTSERQYHVMYSSDSGPNVVADFVTEDSVSGFACTVSGFAIVG